MQTHHRTCPECGKTAATWRAGRCGSCYNRVRRTPEYRKARQLDLTPTERFMAQVKIDPTGCWLWTGGIASNGYGQFAGQFAHRWAYEQFVGPIPEGMHIDHVRAKGCIHRHCVNWVDHLEVVTPQENTLRSATAVAARWAARTHCDNGHEFTPENTAWRKRHDNPEKTYRACRACWRKPESKKEGGSSMSQPLPQRHPVTRDKQPHPAGVGDRWTVSGEFGRVTYDQLGNHLAVHDANGDIDSMGKRHADRVAEYAGLNDDDAVFAVLADLYRTELAGGVS